MANTLNVTAANNGWELPLRGDMTGARLDFTPADNHFKCSFVTQDTGSYVITSAQHQFRALNASAQSSIAIGGKIGLFVELMYDPDKGEFAITKTNLVAGDSGTGGTGTGTASTVAVAATVTGAPGTAALVENIGTLTALQLKFTIPRGDAGATFPTGGTTSQYLGKTGNGDGQIGWLTLPTGSGGSGTGSGTGASTEVLLVQDANGAITPDAALGNRFRVMKTQAITIKNPVGYTPGQDIAIALREGPLGPFPTTWENGYAFKDRQPPTLPQQSGVLVEVFARLTGDIDADNKGGWMTRVTPEASTVGYGVAAFIARNTTRNVSYYVLRSPSVPANQCGVTDMKPGETLKILRNGLGIESFGGIDGSNGAGNFLITGALPNGNRAELRTGPGVRTAFDRGVLAFSAGNVTVQDLILSGAREQSGTAHVAQGISVTGSANVTLKNVRCYDNENGLHSSDDYTGTLTIIDSMFDLNSKGDTGQTHNIYMGQHNVGWSALRTTFQNAATDIGGDGGHNIKSRAGTTTLNQVRTYNSLHGRELDIPNGGLVYATDCIFEHPGSAGQNDCIRIAGEGVNTTRPREYIFRNCHFVNGKGTANEASWIWNDDPATPVYLIDCTFEGAKPPGTTDTTIWPNTDNNGNRGAGQTIVQFTQGVTPGPRVPVGYQSIAVTPVAG